MFVTLRNFFSSTVYFSSRLEAADPTNAWRLFPPVFRKGRMKGQEILNRQTTPVTPCFGQKIVTNIQRLATNKQKHDIEIPQNRLV